MLVARGGGFEVVSTIAARCGRRAAGRPSPRSQICDAEGKHLRCLVPWNSALWAGANTNYVRSDGRGSRVIIAQTIVRNDNPPTPVLPARDFRPLLRGRRSPMGYVPPIALKRRNGPRRSPSPNRAGSNQICALRLRENDLIATTLHAMSLHLLGVSTLRTVTMLSFVWGYHAPQANTPTARHCICLGYQRSA